MAGEIRRLCPHCDETLAPRTFREHLRLFYDADSHTWTKKRKVSSTIQLESLVQSDQTLIGEEEWHVKVKVYIYGHDVLLLT